MAEIAYNNDMPMEEDEEIEDLPKAERDADPLLHAKIERKVNDEVFIGTVSNIERGKESGDRLYLIQYEDGDMEHLTAEQVEELRVDGDEEDEEEEEVAKKPAGRAKSAAKAKAKGKAKAAPAPKAKAKAKAKAAVLKKPAKK
eukprot:TRINITY_DN37446_c0_g1_i1.p3 TRINITY_DN37446_c0_g1~~TRINITY_DN37446_c0_g1_i1.p3  ORF type:complete len:165 (+),score=66.97 TRINITY_DN37446_c0_g1_i1:68-496(+)